MKKDEEENEVLLHMVNQTVGHQLLEVLVDDPHNKYNLEYI